VLDGVDAALDGVFDAVAARRVGERGAAEPASGFHDRADLVGGHLGGRGDPPFLEVDDAAHEELDAVGALGDA
jgi:hypothetical protein